MTFNFRSFPYILGILVCMENSQKCRFLLQVVCGNAGIIFFRKPGFLQIGVFTKYRWFNATKWPQKPQKRKRTIPHGSGHTLGTLNHGLGLLFGCFITLLAPGVASTPLAPPGAPLVAPWPLVCHPGPYSVILGHYESYLTHLEWMIDAHTLLFLMQRYCQIGLFIARGCVHAYTHVRG